MKRIENLRKMLDELTYIKTKLEKIHECAKSGPDTIYSDIEYKIEQILPWLNGLIRNIQNQIKTYILYEEVVPESESV